MNAKMARAKRQRVGSLVAAILAGLLALGIVGIVYMVNLYDRNSRLHREQLERAATPLGDAALVHDMTFGDIKKALRQTPSRTFKDPHIVNQIIVEFGEGLVVLTFLGDDPQRIGDDEVPIGIDVKSPFKGTVCGIMIGDSSSAPLPAQLCGLPTLGKSASGNVDLGYSRRWTISWQGQDSNRGNIARS